MIIKQVKAHIKLQIPAKLASPSPPVGPALGQQGVNIMEFCKLFNERTVEFESGLLVPVVITVYVDRSFLFVIKTPPTSLLLKKAADLSLGSDKPKITNVGKISASKIYEIAQIKFVDMTSSNLESAFKSIVGTAKSMGLEVENDI